MSLSCACGLAFLPRECEQYNYWGGVCVGVCCGEEKGKRKRREGEPNRKNSIKLFGKSALAKTTFQQARGLCEAEESEVRERRGCG